MAGALMETGNTVYNVGGNEGDFDDLGETYNPLPLPPPVVRRPVEVTTADAMSSSTTAAEVSAAATFVYTTAMTAAATTGAVLIETDSPPSPPIPPSLDTYKPQDAKGAALQHLSDMELGLELGPVPNDVTAPVSFLGSNSPTPHPPSLARHSTGPAPFYDVANGQESPLLWEPPRDVDYDNQGSTNQLHGSYNSQVFVYRPARNDDEERAQTTTE